MIKGIVLENWKTHKKSELNFDNGTNVLIGKMGSGKTSLIEAICFGLFGTFPALQRKEISLEEIIMSKPYENDYAKIKLEFEYRGELFSVERSIFKKKSSQAKLYKNEEFLAGPQVSEVSRKIAELLEVDYELFARAIYSEQNQMDYFLKLAPRERKEKFDALLGLDRYEKVRENAVKVKNKMKTLFEERKGFLEQERKQFNEKELKELQEKAAEIKQEIRGLEKKLLEGRKLLEEKEKKLKKAEEKRKEFELLERQSIQGKALVEELEKELREKKLEEEKTVLEKIKEKEKEMQEKEKLYRELNEEITELKEETAVCKNTVVNERELIKHLEKAHANCPICKAILSKEKRETLLQEKKEFIEKLLSKGKKLDEEMEEKNKKLLKGEEEKKLLEKEKLQLNEQLKEIHEMKEKKEKLQERRKELQEIEEKLKKLDFDKEGLQGTQREFEQLKERNNSLKKTMEMREELMKEVEKQVKGILERKHAMKKLEESIEKIKQSGEKISLFVNSLKETQAQLRNTLIETINQAMQDLWVRIYPYKDFSELRMVIEEGNYELKVKTRGKKWERIEGVLSGGERSAVALTARIAFSLVLARNLSWLILDEPTHNLDMATIERVSLLMREHLPELVEQVFLITHEREMENAASASLYILNREKDEEGITKPEQKNIQ